MRIKDWHKFQHFKDRRPLWIKLYRSILDDREWNELKGDDAKMLVELWLLASEDETQEGNLPSIEKVAWRLRKSEKVVNDTVSRLSHWLERRDIGAISDGYQPDIPEKRREETEKEKKVAFDFEPLWKRYPNKDGKRDAERHFRSTVQTSEDYTDIEKAMTNYLRSERVRKGFVKNGSTWFNNWRDWITYTEETNAGNGKPTGLHDRLLARETGEKDRGARVEGMPGVSRGVDKPPPLRLPEI